MRLDANNNDSIRDFENWVKDELYGPRKETTKEQPMSDTLQEPEDTETLREHERRGGEYRCSLCRREFKTLADYGKHKCQPEWCDDCHGYTHMPYCPSYEAVKDVVKGDFQESQQAKYPARVLAELTAAGELNNEQYQRLRREAVEVTEHEPAARGEGDEWRVEYTRGRGYRINDSRGCLAEVRDEATANQIVAQQREYQSLVAEREQWERLLQAAHSLLRMNATNYDRDVMRYTGGFDTLQKAVDVIDQKRWKTR